MLGAAPGGEHENERCPSGGLGHAPEVGYGEHPALDASRGHGGAGVAGVVAASGEAEVCADVLRESSEAYGYGVPELGGELVEAYVEEAPSVLHGADDVPVVELFGQVLERQVGVRAGEHRPAHSPDGVHGAEDEGDAAEVVVYGESLYAEGTAVPEPCPDGGADGVCPGVAGVLHRLQRAHPAGGDAAAGDGQLRKSDLQHLRGGVLRGGGVDGDRAVEHGHAAGLEVLQGDGAAAEVVSRGVYHISRSRF